MTEQKTDDLIRIIVLIYGMLESGSPFWVYAAVRPSKYQAFQAAQKEGALNLYKFEGFGEIIVSGEGKSPPDDITLKVAEMYQTDPATLFRPIDPEAEVAKRMEEALKKPKQPSTK